MKKLFLILFVLFSTCSLFAVSDEMFSSAPKGEHVRLKTDRLSAPVRRTYPQES